MFVPVNHFTDAVVRFGLGHFDGDAQQVDQLGFPLFSFRALSTLTLNKYYVRLNVLQTDTVT